MGHKRIKVIIQKEFTFDRICLDDCEMFGFSKEPKLDITPILLGDGSTMKPGDRFVKIGGKKTSAGFPTLHMLPGHSMEYAGSYSELGTNALCFHQVKDGKVQKILNREGYAFLYYGWHSMAHADTEWMFATRSNAGRIMETTMIERAEH